MICSTLFLSLRLLYYLPSGVSLGGIAVETMLLLLSVRETESIVDVLSLARVESGSGACGRVRLRHDVLVRSTGCV